MKKKNLVSTLEATKLLLMGQVVALPTETVYGLAGDATNEAALKLIFKTKSRPLFDPLIMHVFDSSEINTWVSEWTPLHNFLAERFWPGPLTMVVPKKPTVSNLISAGLSTVALRVPQHPLFREVLKNVGRPLAAPSANRFGKTSPTTVEHVLNEFEGQVPAVDGGPCSIGIESTVVKIDSRDQVPKVSILRPGLISKEDLEEELKEYSHKVHVQFEGQNKASPGTLEDHYQPRIPLLIYEQNQQAPPAGFFRGVEMNLNPDPFLAAREFYAHLHQLGQSDHDHIILRKFAELDSPAWVALKDRILKASLKN
ncbi:MAG: threonylcarbamoyl-AMP synthase [Bdellovibrionales bacterium]|nr:threonylcarbamoyl-AMP synthase [Bdellovibrionales bacterium]